MALTLEQKQALLQEAIAEAWRRGDLRYKFHATQQKIYEAIHQHRSEQFYLLCSRRLGKTFMLLTLAFEVALKTPGARVLFLSDTAKHASDLAKDTAAVLMADCPPKLKPEYHIQDKEFLFSNGSIIRVKGVNAESANTLRGGAQDLIILDECGQMDNLDEVLLSVCLPMVLTTKGRIILATTPPTSPGHDSAMIYERLAGIGATVKYTLLDAPHIDREDRRRTLLAMGEPEEKIEAVLDGAAPPTTTKALREYFCEFVTDADSAVVPEFDAAARKVIVVEHSRPEFFDGYVAMDPGMVDNTAALFGYVDFLQAKLVIEDEILVKHAGTPEIAELIRDAERRNWGKQAPYKRVSDVDKRLISDLRNIHKLEFTQTRKDDSMAAIAFMRQLIQERKIIIHPRCVHLIRQLTNAIWNRKATDFARAGEASIDGHFDLVAALKYMVRNVEWTRNPYPAHYFGVGGKLGPPAGAWTSPKLGRGLSKSGLSLRDNTPLARRLGKNRTRAH